MRRAILWLAMPATPSSANASVIATSAADASADPPAPAVFGSEVAACV